MTYQPHTVPFPHQLRRWEESRDLSSYAAFWEQGTGKSKFLLDTLGHLHATGRVDTAIIVAPGGVHLNWITDEIPTHMPHVRLRSAAYQAEKASTKKHQAEIAELLAFPGLAVLAITYDAWMTDRGKQAVWRAMKKRRVLLALDESHRIKTPAAKRTRSILAGGRHAPFRRILSGTPVTQGPFDMYSQVRFLDPDFWMKELGIDSFTAFKSYFGVFIKQYMPSQDREVELCVDYKNLDELAEIVQRVGSRETKETAGLNLPDKLYTKRYYDMTPAQRRIYTDLDREFSAWLDSGELVTADLAITRMLRLQQVLCGYVPTDGATEPTELIERDVNPRLKLLRETIEDVPGKSIIWAVWTRDIDMIMEALEAAGRRPVRYDGTMSPDDRARSKNRFKHGDATDFVANSSMSEGLTLNEAKTTIYYGNSYKLIDRKQTEDRNHRIGQTDNVLYIDLICPGTRDEHAIKALVKKSSVAATILGDPIGDWI